MTVESLFRSNQFSVGSVQIGLYNETYFNHDHDFCFSLFKLNNLWYVPIGYLSWKGFILIWHLHYAALVTSLHSLKGKYWLFTDFCLCCELITAYNMKNMNALGVSGPRQDKNTTLSKILSNYQQNPRKI